MREQLSKSTKSRRVTPPATPKRPSKKEGSTTAKTLPRQKSVAPPPAKKSSLKAALTKKKTAPPKVAIKVATKKSAIAATTKKSETKSVTKVAKKLPAKEQAKSVKVEKLPAKPTAKPIKSPLVSPAVSKVPPKAAIVSRHQMATQALRAFEQAVKVFNLREFSEAKTLFEELQKRYHQEVEIIARSQTYIQVCNVRLASNRALPRNADEFYDRGIVALNVGNFVQARTLFEKALKLRPDDSYTLYSLAATYAQAGSTDQALTYLERAVQKQPRLRQQALNDTDFSTLKEDRRFLELLGATSPFDLLGSRREIS
jgi:tetratricopeptide (TPR) repeat protein